MARDPGWSVDDYRTPTGGRPVYEFLQGLSKAAKPRVYAVLAMLAAEGNGLLMPHSRSLGEGLHEIRVRHAEGPFRVVYCFRPGRRVVLLHAFVKRSQETPKGDLDIARMRKRDLERRE